MGYFSRISELDYCGEEKQLREKQLLKRLEELNERYEELEYDEAAYNNSFIYSDDDLRHVLPEDLYSVRHIKKAIELAEFDYYIETEQQKSTYIKPFLQLANCESTEWFVA